MQSVIKSDISAANQSQVALDQQTDGGSWEPVLEVEPILDVEKKLVGWSLGIGITLLVVLILVGSSLFNN